MSENFESEWVPLDICKINSRIKYNAASLEIVWDKVSGTKDGVIEIYVSNDAVNMTLGAVYYVETYSNTDNCLNVIMLSLFKYIKIKYFNNSINGGKLSISLYYRETN